MEGLSHYEKDVRPWGHFERLTLNEATTVKIITVKPNEALSLQAHAHRDEFWRVLSGSGSMQIGSDTHEVAAGAEFICRRTQNHRVTGGPEGLTFLEIAFGDFDESDITRLEDKYGRA